MVIFLITVLVSCDTSGSSSGGGISNTPPGGSPSSATATLQPTANTTNADATATAQASLPCLSVDYGSLAFYIHTDGSTLTQINITITNCGTVTEGWGSLISISSDVFNTQFYIGMNPQYGQNLAPGQSLSLAVGVGPTTLSQRIYSGQIILNGIIGDKRTDDQIVYVNFYVLMQ